MADRCEKECPWIRGSRNNLIFSNPVFTMFEGFTSPNAGNEQALEIYRGDMERAEHCPGPVDEPVLVRRGLPWNRRTVTETKIRCGLTSQLITRPTPQATKVGA
jgi:hypothetical protein